MITRYNSNQSKRKQRARARIRRFSDRNRLTVFRSNQHIYAQIIDQKTGNILAAASDIKLDTKDLKKTELAYKVGEQIGKLAKEKKIKEVVFDRGSYKYHGRVKAVCEGARSADLTI